MLCLSPGVGIQCAFSIDTLIYVTLTHLHLTGKYAYILHLVNDLTCHILFWLLTLLNIMLLMPRKGLLYAQANSLHIFHIFKKVFAVCFIVKFGGSKNCTFCKLLTFILLEDELCPLILKKKKKK